MKKNVVGLLTCVVGFGFLLGCNNDISEKDTTEPTQKVSGESKSASKSKTRDTANKETKVREILNNLYAENTYEMYIGTKIVSIEKKDNSSFYVETDNGELQVDILENEWNIYERNTGAKYFSSNGNDVRTTVDASNQNSSTTSDDNATNDSGTEYNDELESLAKEILKQKMDEYPEVLGTEIEIFERRDKLVFYVKTNKDELSLQLKESTEKENTMDWSIAKFGSPDDLFHSEGWESF